MGKSDHDLERFSAPIRHLTIELKIDPTDSATGQVADSLNPELVEVTLFFTIAPSPGFIKAKEHASASADKMLEHERMPAVASAGGDPRSEEHTSELQSHLNLVSRLLLEKKKTTHQTH